MLACEQMADTIEDTGLQRVRPVAEVIDNKTEEAVGGYGAVDMIKGDEPRPCYLCRSYENVDKNRLIRHIMSKGLRPRPDGKFESPIQDDFKTSGLKRANMVLDPRGCGYCRKDGIVTEDNATCDNFTETRTLSEFQQRMVSRRR
jgi:hypothetical protein